MQIIFNNIPVRTTTLKDKDSSNLTYCHFKNNGLNSLSNDVVELSFGKKLNALDFLQEITEGSEKGSLKKVKLRNIYKKRILSDRMLTFIIQSNAGKISFKDYNFFVKIRFPLTKYDTLQVLEQRLYNLKAKQLKPTSKSYLKQKDKILKNEFDKMKQVACERKMTIITGFPGAGKSTVLKELNLNAYNADTDIIKEQFLEYGDGKGSQVVHDASRFLLVKNILPKVLEKGKNLTLQTLGWPHYVQGLVEQAKSNGYSVELIHVDAKIPTAIKRNLKRFEETGRLVDPYYTFQTDWTSPIRNQDLPDAFNDSKFIDKVIVYDNNGTKPVLRQNYN